MDDKPPTAQATEPPPPDFVPLRLILEQTGAMVELHRVDNLIGRHSEADVRLPLPDVSRRHCRFLWKDAQWQVLDLHSLNGIFVNDQAVQHATLQQGDRVRIGGFTFIVDLRSAAGLAREDWSADSFQTYPPHQRQAS
jgi:pSer/pThr/pTyr-binding forkhead associated (FHA) protein